MCSFQSSWGSYCYPLSELPQETEVELPQWKLQWWAWEGSHSLLRDNHSTGHCSELQNLKQLDQHACKPSVVVHWEEGARTSRKPWGCPGNQPVATPETGQETSVWMHNTQVTRQLDFLFEATSKDRVLLVQPAPWNSFLETKTIFTNVSSFSIYKLNTKISPSHILSLDLEAIHTLSHSDSWHSLLCHILL